MKFLSPLSSCFGSTSDNIVLSPNFSTGGVNTTQNFRVFSYNELKAATHGFKSSNKVGEGGFGSVFKGRLQDGTFVAVKVLSIELGSLQGEREFVSEIAALSDIKHENLVNLRGCCVDGARRLLVYDYMENNSLAHTFLGGVQNRIRFNWKLRREISIGVARGLAYLHEEVNPYIVHRDIKGSNVLIDQNFVPKISDFGLARIFRDDKSHISTLVAGTLGYLSPEYAVTGHLTRKSDVYSFGVLLLEIVSGRPVVHFDLERGEHFLVDLAWEIYSENDLVNLVDPILDNEFPDEEATRFLKVGLLCVQKMTRLRPSMSTAIKMLTNELDIEGVKISQPGIVADLMDVKIGDKHSSYSSSTTKTSTIISSGSPLPKHHETN